MNWLKQLLLVSVLAFSSGCIPGSVLLTKDSCLSLVRDSEYQFTFNSEAGNLSMTPGWFEAFNISLERINDTVAVTQEPLTLTATPSSSEIDVELSSQVIRVDGEAVRINLQSEKMARLGQYYITFQTTKEDRNIIGCVDVTIEAD